MLNADPVKGQQVIVTPDELKDQIPWKTAKGVVVMVLNDQGEHNQLFISCPVTVEQLALLSKQLDAHLTCILGPMKEGF